MQSDSSKWSVVDVPLGPAGLSVHNLQHPLHIPTSHFHIIVMEAPASSHHLRLTLLHHSLVDAYWT